LSRGSSPCGCPHKPLVSYRINRQLSGWIPPPLMIRAFGAHCHERTRAAQQTKALFDRLVGVGEQRRSTLSFSGVPPYRTVKIAWTSRKSG
jgi:hypothetical protein